MESIVASGLINSDFDPTWLTRPGFGFDPTQLTRPVFDEILLMGSLDKETWDSAIQHTNLENTVNFFKVLNYQALNQVTVKNFWGVAPDLDEYVTLDGVGQPRTRISLKKIPPTINGYKIHCVMGVNLEGMGLSTLENIPPYIGNVGLNLAGNNLTSFHDINKHLRSVNGPIKIGKNKITDSVMGFFFIKGHFWLESTGDQWVACVNEVLRMDDLSPMEKVFACYDKFSAAGIDPRLGKK
jgi:hypothetical protein